MRKPPCQSFDTKSNDPEPPVNPVIAARPIASTASSVLPPTCGVPMISAMFELRESRAELAKARAELIARGIETPDVPLGIMVETPSAVLLADMLSAGNRPLMGLGSPGRKMHGSMNGGRSSLKPEGGNP